MENVLILTPGSWKSIDKITPATKVYRVTPTNLSCTIDTIDHWKDLNGLPTYAAWNRYDQQVSFFAHDGEVIFQRSDDRQWYTTTGDQLYRDADNTKIYLADQPTFESCNVKRAFITNEINKAVRLGRLNTSFIDGPSQLAAQALYAWKQTHGTYKAKDWNQALFLQALFIKTEVTSNLVQQDNGLNVVPSPRDRFDVTDLTHCKRLQITMQPVDKNGSVVHVIANYRGHVFVM